MTPFQIVMLLATAFFAYKIYEFVQNMEEPTAEGHRRRASGPEAADAAGLVDAADNAFEAGELGEAKALLSEADVLSPDTPEILNKLGFILSKEGDIERALEHYNRSLEIDGKDDLVHNALASLYRERGEFDRAREHYEAALAIDDAYEVTYFNYGNLLVATGDRDAARRMYGKALELKPDFMQAKFELEKLS
jgi:tetratricopeptide (TPR) repeat protein